MNNGYGYNSAVMKMNYKNLRCICFWAGGFGLAQSIAWIGLTLTGILSYNCVVTINNTFNYGSLFGTIFLDLYFRSDGCNDQDSNYPSYSNTVLKTVSTILDPQQILIWDSVYLAVAVCWLISSVLIMIYVKKDQPRATSSALWTWISITCIICLMDLALGIIFGIDYSNFQAEAYLYNLNGMYSGSVNPDASQLLAGMVASVSMMILSLKGFVLWLINVTFMVYLIVQAIYILKDNDGMDTLFMPRKESDDILATREPIKAYQEDARSRHTDVMSTAFSNEAFVEEEIEKEVIQQDLIANAARKSMDASLMERRFRNLDNFSQYPAPNNSRPDSGFAVEIVQPQQQQVQSPVIMGQYPRPDYTPPMQRAINNANRNQRY